MDGLPRRGVRVRWQDPWFYDGEGIVLATQVTPHHSVQVQILEIDDPTNQTWVGRTTWLLPGYLTVLCKGCGHAIHLAGLCVHNSRPACNCNDNEDET